jgi:hypothetical protein
MKVLDGITEIQKLDRQNAVQANLQELNAKLAALVEVFGEDWLQENGGRPLQALWRRQDALATNDIYLSC